jgi:hypothetical protein
VEVEPVGELTLKGFHRPITAHNIVRLKGIASEGGEQ